MRTGGGGRPRNLLYVWSLPWGLVGLLCELACRALGWTAERADRQTLVRGPLAAWMSRRGWAAMTIGWSIFYWSKPTLRTTIHEHRHVQQCLWFGPFMPLLYLLCLVLYGYRDNPFEVDARDESKDA